jgi:hypothetical protein
VTYLKDGDYFVLPDMQVPFHDEKAVNALIAHVATRGYDGILCVGDEADLPTPARWNKDTHAEFAQTIETELTKCHDILHGFADALNQDGEPKPFHMMRSNHTARLQNYLTKYAPAMAGTSWNRYERIIGYGETPLLEGRDTALPIEWHNELWHFAKGWCLAHGDESNASPAPAGTAINMAKKTGTSIVCGHTHKLGFQHFHTGAAGKDSQLLYGVEAGHLMRKDADYLKLGYSNWNQGFVQLFIRKGRVYSALVPFQGRSFVADGILTTW